jgi:hypothetical protein
VSYSVRSVAARRLSKKKKIRSKRKKRKKEEETAPVDLPKEAVAAPIPKRRSQSISDKGAVKLRKEQRLDPKTGKKSPVPEPEPWRYGWDPQHPGYDRKPDYHTWGENDWTQRKDKVGPAGWRWSKDHPEKYKRRMRKEEATEMGDPKYAGGHIQLKLTRRKPMHHEDPEGTYHTTMTPAHRRGGPVSKMPKGPRHELVHDVGQPSPKKAALQKAARARFKAEEIKRRGSELDEEKARRLRKKKKRKKK